MYLRTTKRKNKSGETVSYYQLAHNERNPKSGKPVARVIHNFGRADHLERDAMVRLCRSIAKVCGVTVADPLEEPETAVAEDNSVWPEDLQLIRTLSYGDVTAVEQIWERLAIGETLRKVCRDNKMPMEYERALLAMTANRLCRPASKLGVWERWLETVYLPSCNGLKLRQMYEAMDLLHENIDEVERAIFFSVANLMNLDVDLIFYDTTTASFQIDYEDEESGRMFGRSKEGTWTPQVVVALAVTRDGLPVRSWVLPGNTTDVATVKQVKKDLRGWNLSRAMFVADAGMNSEDNRSELARACGKYILACRMSSVSEIKKKVLTRRGPYTEIKANLHCKEVVVGDGERRRRYVLCYNPGEAERTRKHRERVVEDLTQILDSHPEKNATASWAAKLRASRRYGKYLSVSKNGAIRIDKAKIREAKKYDGKWVIETNDDTITLADAACGYRSLMVIERCFRSLKKAQIQMTPMYHWLPHRIVSHVKICVLALLIERYAELQCETSWHHIAETLGRLQASEFFSNKFRFYRRNEIPQQALNMLEKLKINVPKQVLSVVKHS